ncbi:MAG: hypothetical protein AVO39_10390 [delta proteobacterium MLS_D]|jgi:hypothetical protein|nr:MAG: hypothetical protein AVO39_10390 [delta proteobacterium MLS_D]
MSVAVKRKLSGSTDGKGIEVAATATPGTAIHTAVAGTTAGTFDEVWLWAQNNHTEAVTLTVEFGDANTENNIIIEIPSKEGLVPVVPGFLLQNEATVKAFAGTADVITVHGFVNNMADS